VLEVPSLSLLPQAMIYPLSMFPEHDVAVFERDLRYEPAGAKPGDPITVTAVIRNAGGRDARLTTGIVTLNNEEGPLGWREFVADIPVDGTFEASFPATMPAAGVISAYISDTVPFTVDRPEPYGQLTDVNPDNNRAEKKIRAMQSAVPSLPR